MVNLPNKKFIFRRKLRVWFYGSERIYIGVFYPMLSAGRNHTCLRLAKGKEWVFASNCRIGVFNTCLQQKLIAAPARALPDPVRFPDNALLKSGHAENARRFRPRQRLYM